MDGRPNRRTKAAFSNYSGSVWTGPMFLNPQPFYMNICGLKTYLEEFHRHLNHPHHRHQGHLLVPRFPQSYLRHFPR